MLIGALVALVLGFFRPTRFLPSLATGVLLPLVLLTYTPLLHVGLSAMTFHQAPVPADAIVILGGGVDCATGTLMPEVQQRFDQGVRLWQAGYAPVLVLSQASEEIRQPGCPSDAEVEERLLRQMFPGADLRLEVLQDVRDTEDEAQATAELVEQHHWGVILLVTSNWHSRRAAGLFRKVGVQVISVPAQPVPKDAGFVPSYTERHLLLREAGAYLKAVVQGQL